MDRTRKGFSVSHFSKLQKIYAKKLNVTLDNLKTTFDAMRDTLSKDYAGKWVAIYEGGVVDSDTPDSVLIGRFYRKYGIVSVYTDKVGEKRVPKIRSPRRMQKKINRKKILTNIDKLG